MRLVSNAMQLLLNVQNSTTGLLYVLRNLVTKDQMIVELHPLQAYEIGKNGFGVAAIRLKQGHEISNSLNYGGPPLLRCLSTPKHSHSEIVCVSRQECVYDFRCQDQIPN